jgi:hypothetical protein
MSANLSMDVAPKPLASTFGTSASNIWKRLQISFESLGALIFLPSFRSTLLDFLPPFSPAEAAANIFHGSARKVIRLSLSV